MMSSNISQLIQTGLEHHQSGRLQEAESVYLSILKEQPQQPDALHLLGVLALQAGKSEIAVNLMESAIKIKPDEPEFYNMCGEAYRALHKYDMAISRYERALAIKPDFAGAYNNLGNACKELGWARGGRVRSVRRFSSMPEQVPRGSYREWVGAQYIHTSPSLAVVCHIFFASRIIRKSPCS